MATLHVRNVPDDLYEALRAQAEANGRSIGAEAIQLLESQLAPEDAGAPSLGRRRRMPGTDLLSRFTERGRRVVAVAQETARQLGHDHVGTGHMLVGLLCVEDGVAASALRSLGLDEAGARAELERRLGREEPLPTDRQIAFAAEAKTALEFALREALALRHAFIGTEHVLLGIVELRTSLGAAIVRAVEPDEANVRARVLSLVPGIVAGRHVVDMLVPSPSGSLFRVVELEGDAAAWERQLNEAAARGYDLVELVDRRAILRRC